MDRQLVPLDFISTTTPGIPASGFVRVYARPDGKLYARNDQGVEFDLTASDGGGGSSDLIEVTVDPEFPRPGQQWILRYSALAPAPLLTGFWGMAFPMPIVIQVEAHALSVNTSFGIKRTPLQ
jgi:hypothetical protein